MKLYFILIGLAVSFNGAAFCDDIIRHDILTGSGEQLGTFERTVIETDTGRVTTVRQILNVRADGTRPTRVINEKVRVETPAGTVSRLEFNTQVGRQKTETIARINDATATVTRRVMGDTRAITLALPDDVRFDNGAALMRAWRPDIEPEVTFHTLDPRGPHVERIIYDSPPQSDETRILRRRSYVEGQLYGVSYFDIDADGQLGAGRQPMFGEGVVKQATVEDEAATLDRANLVESVLFRSPYRIPAQAIDQHLRYTFTFPDDLAFAPPETGEQRVRRTDAGFTLDICETCGQGLPTDATYLAEARAPTFWLQADHAKLRRAAKRARGNGRSDRETMDRLARWGAKQMRTVDFAGHYSALEALSLRRGDCTEGATVLAALGRAAGIPTKVVSGIVYSRERYHGVSHTFMPHAWVVAYTDGEWRSFDMSLDGFDSTHLAFSIGDGDPGSIQSGHVLAGLVDWGPMTQVKQRPKD